MNVEVTLCVPQVTHTLLVHSAMVRDIIRQNKTLREAGLFHLSKHFPPIFSLKNFSYTHPYSPAYNTDPGRYDNRDRNLQATPKSDGCDSSGFPACETNWVSSYKQPNSHSCDHLHVSEPEILLLKT